MSEPDVDLLIVERRFEEAARLSRDEETVRALLDLGLAWGRYALVRDLRARLPGVVDDAAWVAFLYDRALPMVPWRRVGATVRVDRGVLDAIAADLGVSPAAAATLASRILVAAKTRNLGKLDDLAFIAEESEAATWVREQVARRERSPRESIGARLRARGDGYVLTVLQRGDADEDDPKVAWVWLAEAQDRRFVIKEHLAHPTNWSHLGGGNDEPGLLAAVSHPNLVRLESSHLQAGDPTFAMEYVAGARPPVAAEALRIGRDVASALAALHANDVVVFDLKPDNVLWDGERAVVIDLGFAQHVSPTEPAVATLHGSPRGVAPEVLRRWRGGKPADLFQFGLALFSWLTGEHAFAESNVADEVVGVRTHYASAILHGAPRLHRLARSHRPLVGALIDPSPGARPTAAELSAQLQEHV